MKITWKYSLILTLIGCISLSLSATEQIRDKFISSSGEIYDIYGNYPLADFFREHPERRPINELVSSALWRGYIAYFQMSREHLYLVDVRIPDGTWNRTESVMANVFPDEDKVPATWFNGHVAFPLPGEEVNGKYNYLEYSVEAGKISNRKVVDHYHDVVINTGRPSAGMGVREYDLLSSRTEPGRAYYAFESLAEIKNGKLSLMSYSPEEEALVPNEYPEMNIFQGNNYHSLYSEGHKGILLQSDQLLFVYVDHTDSPVYRGCLSGNSSQCEEGIYPIPFEEFPWIGKGKTLSVDSIFVKDIIISSGVLDLDNPEAYYEYSRPRSIRITNHTTGEVIDAELEDTAHPQSISLGEEGHYELSLEILTVYSGNKSENIGINFILAKGW